MGFQEQLFARLVDVNNATIPTTFVWTSETPAVASIDQNGVMHALAAGSAILRATAADGTTRHDHAAHARAGGGHHGAVRGQRRVRRAGRRGPERRLHRALRRSTRPRTTPIRGTPNWVSYDLDATHFGTEDRCDCFTMDRMLPASFPQLTTADYTGAGAFHGYGIDRGHLARSFDRTTGSLDNAYTYLFDNIVPQAADLNQGPWAIFENFLGDEARNSNKRGVHHRRRGR